MSPSRYFGRPVQLFFCGQGYLLLLLCAALCVAWFAVEKISLDIFLFATTALNDMHRQTNERTKGTLRRRGDTARGVEQRCLTTASSLWLCCEHDLRRRGPRGRGGRGPRRLATIQSSLKIGLQKLYIRQMLEVTGSLLGMPSSFHQKHVGSLGRLACS